RALRGELAGVGLLRSIRASVSGGSEAVRGAARAASLVLANLENQCAYLSTFVRTLQGATSHDAHSNGPKMHCAPAASEDAHRGADETDGPAWTRPRRAREQALP